MSTDEVRWEKWDDLRTRQELATTQSERDALALEEEDLRQEGVLELMREDMQQSLGWWWLSFADDTGFLGVAIVEAGGIMEAAVAAKLAGCNPGGEVLAYPIPVDKLPVEKLRNRLLSRDDLEEAGLA
jgi:hypothetical protein